MSRAADPSQSGSVRYAMLVQPSANRVYAHTALRMLRNEVAALGDLLLQGRVEDLEERRMGGTPYLVLTAHGLTDDDLRCLANASSLLALFELHEPMLLPVAVDRLDRYDDDLLTILKYSGKTNEQLTKLLLNLTAAAATTADRFLRDRLRVLDPMCGRGTTLNQALMYGWEAYGVDVDTRDVEAYSAFVQRWLTSKRLKHKATSGRVRKDGRNLGRRTSVELAATKDLYRAGEVQTLEVTAADTLSSAEMYRPGYFDVVVTDAPYGVQHGSVRASGALSRSPADLLAAAIPVWSRLLRRGGALGLSWNTKVLARADLEQILVSAGLEPLTQAPLLDLAHRVDQAIDRDLVVARRPA